MGPWDIYQKHLFSVGYGVPLWHPEPNEREDGSKVPIDIGVVGRMVEGQLRVLCNVSEPETHAANARGLPPDIEPFSVTKKLESCDNKIGEPVIASRNMKAIQLEAQAQVSGYVSVCHGSYSVLMIGSLQRCSTCRSWLRLHI